MSENDGLSRRAFLRNAGMTAIAGAVGTGTSLGTAAASVVQTDGTFDFDTPFSRVGMNTVKWDSQIRRFGEGKIKVGMGIADMDFEAAPCIDRALAERCKHKNWGYETGSASFVESIINWNKRHYGLDIDPDSLVLSSGVHPGVIAALQTFSPPGSKVLLTTPTYNGFYGDVRVCRLEAEQSPMKVVNGRYSIDFEDLERRISFDTNTMILCNPQNPTGNCWTAEDLMRLGEICLKHRVIVLSDEIHCDLVMKGQKYTPFASLPDKDIVDNSITFKAASKTFSLSAMKIGWFFSTNPDYLARVRANHRGGTNTLGVVAVEADLTEGEDWMHQALAYIDGNHDFVEAYLREKMPSVKYTKAQGTYLAWLDVSQVVDKIGAKEKAAERSKTSTRPVAPTRIVEEWLVDNAGVHLNPGSSYGVGGEACMRMNIAVSRKTIELALNNMAEALVGL